MSKILLAYEDGEFNIKVNDTIIKKETDLEAAVEVFKQTVKNNGVKQGVTWHSVVESLKEIEQVKINHDYKTVTFGSLRYFYNTGQVFYICEGQMKTLVGGFDVFKHMVEIISKGQDEKSLVELCIYVSERHATFSLGEQTLYIAYGAFSYGSVGYDFRAQKMDKGTSSEKTTFESFKEYVLSIVK